MSTAKASAAVDHMKIASRGRLSPRRVARINGKPTSHIQATYAIRPSAPTSTSRWSQNTSTEVDSKS